MRAMKPSFAMRTSLAIVLLATGIGTSIASSNAASSNLQLRGPNLIRYQAASDFPEVSESWNEVLQGAAMGDGGCGFSYSIQQSIDEATPTVGRVLAIDPDTCQAEIMVGIPTAVVLPGSGGELESATSAGFSSNGIESMGEAESSTAGYYMQATGYAFWEDVANIDVNYTLAAVRGYVSGGTFTYSECLHNWWRLVATGWVRDTAGSWSWTGCPGSATTAKAWTNGHFYNDGFPACTSRAHVYYDNVWVLVDTNYYYHAVNFTWAEGASCSHLLHFAGWGWYPAEYWN